MFEEFEEWRGKDASVEDWNTYFFGEYSYPNESGWSKWEFKPYAWRYTTKGAGHRGEIDLTWDVELDALLARVMPAPNARMTNLLNHFIMNERNGDWDDINLFESWYDLQTGDTVTFRDELYTEYDFEVRYNLIKNRIEFAHEHSNSDNAALKLQADKITRWLEQAYEALVDDPETVFKTNNGFSGNFPDPFDMYVKLRALHYYACGEELTSDCIVAEGEDLRQFYNVYTLYVDPTNTLVFNHTTQQNCIGKWEEGNQRILGYILQICDIAVQRAIEGNSKKNQQIKEQAWKKQLASGLRKRGDEETLGIDPYGHDHYFSFHTGHTRYFLFHVDSTHYAAFTSLETPSGKVPVFEWDYEYENQILHESLSTIASIWCQTCNRNWDYEHGGFIDNDALYKDPYRDLDNLPYIYIDELQKRGPSIVGNVEPISKLQLRLFEDEQLYEGALLHPVSNNPDEVVFIDGIVTIDDDDNVYCPICHNKLCMSCSIDTY